MRLLSLDPFDATGVLARLAPRLDDVATAAADAATRAMTEGLDALPAASAPLLDITGRAARRLDASASSPPDPDSRDHTHDATRRSCHAPRPLSDPQPAHLSADARPAPTAPAAPCASAWAAPSAPARPRTVAALCRTLRDELSIAVVTNDIYTREDAEFLLREAVLPPERITAVETGACPHTAIRDDISANLEAVEDLEDELGPLDLVLVESGGDNLTATFSKGLVDAQIFVIDVAGGDDIPRKGGPGVTTADLLVVNKTDLAPYVGSDLDRMALDAKRQRGDLPVAFPP